MREAVHPPHSHGHKVIHRWPRGLWSCGAVGTARHRAKPRTVCEDAAPLQPQAAREEVSLLGLQGLLAGVREWSLRAWASRSGDSPRSQQVVE